jgi:signal transduction histidine kinase
MGEEGRCVAEVTVDRVNYGAETAYMRSEVKMYRQLSSRLFHIPMVVVLLLLAALAGALYQAGHDYRVAVLFVILAILFYLVYGFLVVPKIYTRPAGRLVQGAQALAKGDTNVEWGTGYRGELMDLRTALETLTGTLRAAEAFAESGVSQSAPVISCESLGSQLSDTARALTAALENMASGSGQATTEDLPALDEALRRSRHLAGVGENLREIARLEGAGADSPDDVRFCELMRNIEDESAALAGNPATAVITACDDGLAKSLVSADRACLKGMIMGLVREGMAACGECTVTVLASLQKRERDDYLELCVAHAMRGSNSDQGERRFSETAPLHHESSALSLARKSCALLGGSLEVEQTPGKGSVVTILVPARLRPAG